MKLIKSKLAEDDLIRVWLYSFKKWGVDQADRYIDELYNTFDLIVQNANLGASADSILQGYRQFVVGSHIIFYCVDADSIFVSRVLHQEMDFASNSFNEE